MSSKASNPLVSRRAFFAPRLRWFSSIILAAALALVSGASASAREVDADSVEAAGETGSKPPAEIVSSRVDSFVAPFVTMRDFSGSILIARAGHVLVSRGYGFADFDGRLVPDNKTKYGIGSITKTMTAAGIELLAARGRLTLADPIVRHLPGFENGDSITIRNLLAHSSGLRDYYSWPLYTSGWADAISQSEFLAALQAQPLDFSPGSRSAYSNSGYFVLAAIIERVSGVPFAEFIQRELFLPLGMIESGSLTDGVMHGLALGYDAGFPPSRVQPAASVGTSWLEGSGSVYASTQDLYRWLKATRDETLVNLSALSYPYGWGKATRFGQGVLEQNGRVPIGYSSYVAWYSRDDLIVIVLSNIQSEVVEQMGVGLAAIALGKGYENPRLRAGFNAPQINDDELFSTYTGRYEIAPELVLTVRSVPKGILIAGPDGIFIPLDHEGADRFFFRTLYVPITFERDSNGRVNALDWNGQFKAKRLHEDAEH